MRVLITGGSGFIGNRVLYSLLKSNTEHQVMVLTRGGESVDPLFRCDKVQWVNANLNDGSEYDTQLGEFKPEIVVHLAWQGIPDLSIGQSAENIINSLVFFQKLWNSQSCQKVIVAGSCLENLPVKAINIDSKREKIESHDYFVWAKDTLHRYLKLKCAEENITLCWMRIFYVYGPRQRQGSLLHTIIHSLRDRRLPKLKTPRTFNDFIYVDDVADGFIRAVENVIPTGTYDLGSGKLTEVLEICNIAEKIILGTDHHTRTLAETNASTLPKVGGQADIDNTTTKLGWHPTTSLEQGIRQTWDVSKTANR